MPAERVFLGDSKPALHLAVEFMFAKFCEGELWNMSRSLVVLSSRRAARRLRELLVLKVSDVNLGEDRQIRLLPPVICTTGDLPELLNPPTLATVSDVDHLLAMTFALQSLTPQDAAELIPGAFTSGKMMPWLRAAAQLIELRRELAAGGVTFAQVMSTSGRTTNGAATTRRWQMLDTVQERCNSILASAGLHDRETVREATLISTPVGFVGASYDTVILLGIMDAPYPVTSLLHVCSCPVVALIHADGTLKEGFTEFGAINPDFWLARAVELDDRNISMVQSPTDQARETARIIGELLCPPVKTMQPETTSQPGGGTIRPEHIFVSCADETLLGPVEQAIELRGIDARPPSLDGATRTPPFVMLGLLAEFLRSHSPEAFARLIRHPDIEDWLSREWRQQRSNHTCSANEGQTRNQTSTRLPLSALLDVYLQQAIPGTVEAGEPAMPPQLNHSVELILGLEQTATSHKSSPADWAVPLRNIISSIYRGRKFRHSKPQDQPSAQAITVLGDHLRAWRMTQLPSIVQCMLTLAEALELLIWQAGDKEITPQEEMESVQLSGWLEVSLDDSPVLIVTGVNEGTLPRSVNTDPFIPDSIREELGLQCNKSRYAQDLFVLSTALKCRPLTHVVTARVTADNSPLAPSRLLTACDNDRLVARTLRFYVDQNQSTPEPLLPFAETSKLAMLPMPEVTTTLTRLNVTAFRDYLTCPYRFYLRHILRLRTVDEDPRELAANQFGHLAHFALHSFANRVLENEDGISMQSAEEIAEELSTALKDVVQRQLGKAARAAAVLQCNRLHARLRAFAVKQHELFSQGWRIVAAEQELSADLMVDGSPFTIYGRVDRIDVNVKSGQCRILDYKTASRAKTPDQIHRKGPKSDKRWIDLQLPLYVHLARQFNPSYVSVMPGYVLLPAVLEEIGVSMADSWTPEDIARADDTAYNVIRNVRAHCFWPPSDPREVYADGFERIALDTYPVRAGVIKRQCTSSMLSTGHRNNPETANVQ